MNAVQAIEDASKEMHVLPVGSLGNSELQSGIQPRPSMQMSHSVAQDQQQQHHHAHHQQHHHHQLSTSQTSHRHQQSHHQSAGSQPIHEPISPHSQVSISPHPPQTSHSPHHPLQQSSRHLQHSSLSTSHSLDLDHPHPLTPQPPSSTSASSMLLHSQGVNTSESGADIASSSQRSHICITCLKGFRSKQQLVQHSLVHSNIRKYSCAYCDRTFKQLSHLQQHIRIHTAEGETEKQKVEDQRSFRCQYCQRAFKQLIHLQQHTRLHTGEKPYACKFEDCDRAFAQMSNLQHHMRNHEEQVKKEVLRIHKCLVCHRSYTNEGSLRAHTLKMHMHMKLIDDPNPEEQPLKKHHKKENKQLQMASAMVRPEEGQSTMKKSGAESSSDDDLVALGDRKEHNIPSVLGSIPRSLMESLNHHYERSLAAGMSGKKLQDGNISSSNQSGQTIPSSSESRDAEFGRSSNLGLQGLTGLSNVDPTILSTQPSVAIERVAAAAAAAVSGQLLQSSNSTTTTSSLNSFQPHPQPAHSQLMDSHLRSQVTPITLPPIHDQYYAHSGPPLGVLSSHARFLSPRIMDDIPMSYGSQVSSASAIVTSSHLTLSSGPQTSSRPQSALASPHQVSEPLNFNP